MKLWITCFILLFGTSELLQWFRQFSLPLPVFILGGVFLAVASNYDKLSHLPFHLDYEEPELPQKQVASVAPAPGQATTLHKQRVRSISFEIRKPFRPGARAED
jgi:hypothetical protein